MTRFAFDKPTRDAFNTACSLGIIDPVELGCLMANHGTDAAAIMGEITECAFASVHCPGGGERHGAWCEVNDAWAVSQKPTVP